MIFAQFCMLLLLCALPVIDTRSKTNITLCWKESSFLKETITYISGPPTVECHKAYLPGGYNYNFLDQPGICGVITLQGHTLCGLGTLGDIRARQGKSGVHIVLEGGGEGGYALQPFAAPHCIREGSFQVQRERGRQRYVILVIRYVVVQCYTPNTKKFNEIRLQINTYDQT